MKWFRIAAFALGFLCWDDAARANGRFPSAGHVEVDSADASHIVLRTTYGLLVTRDGGRRWDWVCETALGFSGIWDPPIGIAAGGSVLVGLPDGLAVSTPDACHFPRVETLEGKLVADLAVDKKNPARAVVLTSTPVGAIFDTRLFMTEDGGASFVQVGNVFPENLRGLTVDLAPSDPSVVYVSGVLGGPMSRGVIFRSANGGVSYITSEVPLSDDVFAPFIGAVDPENADRVYVRLDGLPGRLFVSEDGGGVWQEIFSGQGSLLGFTLSPDGKTLAVGGEKDGVWRSPVPQWAFEQTSLLHARCLRWADAGMYACTEQVLDGFSVGLSTTEGSTFQPLSRLSDVCGPVSCSSPICVAEWPAMRTLLNATSCDEVGSSSGGGSGVDAGTGGQSNDLPSAVGGCVCGMGRGDDDVMAVLCLAVLSFSRMRRRLGS